VTEERKRVLEMLAAGQINADEADRLLEALRDGPTKAATGEAPRPAPRYLRVMVDSNDKDERPVKINVRVPLQLLRAGVRLASLIPPQAQERVNAALREKGMTFDVSQIKPENLNELIDQLSDFSVDIDQKEDDLKIKVFCE
jgi:hypothetical protein